MILAASPNTIRSLARKAGLRSADVYIKDVSWDGWQAVEVYVQSGSTGSLDAIDWLCDLRERYPELTRCQTCGHLEAPDWPELWCEACGLPV